MDLGRPSVHRREYEVRARDCGADGGIKDEALLEVLQEEAAAHADSLKVGFSDLLPAGRTWLLARLRVDVDRRPRYRERLSVSTWPSGLAGLIALRDFLVESAEGEVLARASSSWLLVDFATRRPLRPELVKEHLPEGPARVLDADPAKIPDFGGTPGGGPFRVLASDLDVNGHVNNTVYARMLEDGLAEEGGERRPRSIEANFLGEAFRGDELSLILSEASGDKRLAKLVNGSGAECARFSLSY
jgi:medium-chain acyl-[acyl-carrier-protein] hydrolase